MGRIFLFWFGAAVCLLATTSTAQPITLTWTATGDDGSVGTATKYDLRYHRYPLSEDNWDLATPITNLPPPAPPGTRETITVYNLPLATSLFFGIKACDEAGNWSPISNCAVCSYCPEECIAQRGNVDGDPDDHVDLYDIVYMINYLWGDPLGPPPPCPVEANVNADPDGNIDASDLMMLVDYIFLGDDGPSLLACPDSD